MLVGIMKTVDEKNKKAILKKVKDLDRWYKSKLEQEDRQSQQLYEEAEKKKLINRLSKRERDLLGLSK